RVRLRVKALSFLLLCPARTHANAQCFWISFSIDASIGCTFFLRFLSIAPAAFLNLVRIFRAVYRAALAFFFFMIFSSCGAVYLSAIWICGMPFSDPLPLFFSILFSISRLHGTYLV